MALTKKHFTAIAGIFAARAAAIHADASCNAKHKENLVGQLYYVARDQAAYFASENPLFDRERFLKACGF